MRANGIVATSSTGGAGALTLGAVASGAFAQSPQYTSVFGAGSVAILVEYSVYEATDATLQTVKQLEQGVGFLNPSTGVLARTKIKSTWVYGSGYAPNAGGTAPSAVSFGTTAANIRIYCSPLADSFLPAAVFPNLTNAGTGTVADNLGLPAAHHVGFGGTNSATNYVYYFPFLWDRFGLVSSASVYLAGGAVSLGAGYFALYEDDGTGWAGNLVIDFAAAAGAAPFNFASTGLKTSTLTTPALLKPQWYIGAFLTNSAFSIEGAASVARTPWGTVNGAIIASASKSTGGWAGSWAATGIASSGFAFSSSFMPPSVMLK